VFDEPGIEAHVRAVAERINEEGRTHPHGGNAVVQSVVRDALRWTVTYEADCTEPNRTHRSGRSTHRCVYEAQPVTINEAVE
jgi:hypothetical protein